MLDYFCIEDNNVCVLSLWEAYTQTCNGHWRVGHSPVHLGGGNYMLSTNSTEEVDADSGDFNISHSYHDDGVKKTKTIKTSTKKKDLNPPAEE